MPLWEDLDGARVFDLAQDYFVGMPHYPTHPPFLYSLNRQHGDNVGPKGHSSASDAIAMGSHVGTHIDALCHFSCGGKLYGGDQAADVQSYGEGLRRHSIDTISPILRRGVLLDIAGARGVPALAADDEITPDDLESVTRAENVDIRPGALVLLRPGWANYFSDPARFIAQVHGPGPGLPGAEWLSQRAV